MEKNWLSNQLQSPYQLFSFFEASWENDAKIK